MTRGGARPGAGRKPLPAARKRGRRIVVYLTPAEVRELEAAAKASGEPLGEVVRGIVFRALRRRRK